MGDHSAMMKKVAWQNTIHQALQQEREKSLAEFAKNTSFHGVKYIFDGEESTPFRRILWLACWMTAIGLFAYQVSERIMEFRKHPTNVDVKILYNDSVIFPTVTVCNQNQFRFQSAANQDMYDLLNTVYRTNDPKGINLSAFDYPKTRATDDLFMDLAHEKLDFIASCKWDYQECDRDSAFTMATTDMGYCFTFNAVNASVESKKVTEPGIRAGLRLVFNVEQYDYMRGPHSDAGIKVYLHDWKEFPLVTDMGFSAAPGSHTVATVKSIQVSNLGPPYGNCRDGAEPMNNCRLECLTRHAMKKCGCRDIFMLERLGNESIPLCDIEKKLKCITALTNQVQNGDNCPCSQPCQRQRYEVSLSNAQLSRFNIRTTVIRDNAHYRQVQQDFYDSVEMGQRVISESVIKNQKIMGKALKMYNGMVNALDSLVLTTSNTSILAARQQTLDLMEQGREVLDADIDGFKQKARWLDDLASGIAPDKDTLEDVKDIQKMFEKMSWREGQPIIGFRDVLEKCIQLEAAAGPSGPSGPEGPADGPIFSNPDNDCKELNEKIKDVLKKCSDVQEEYGPGGTNMFADWKTRLETVVDDLFDGSTKTPRPAHQECLTNLDLVHKNFQIVTTLMMDTVDSAKNGSGYAELTLNLANQLIALNITDGTWLNKEGEYPGCNWLSEAVKNSEEYKAIESTTTYHTKMDELMTTFGELAGLFKEIWQSSNETMRPTLELLDKYFKSEVTKRDIVDPFSSMDFREAITSLFSKSDTMGKYSLYVELALAEIEKFIQKLTSSLKEAPVPLLKNEDYLNLTIVQAVQDLQNEDIQAALADIGTPEKTEEAFGNLMRAVIWSFFHNLQETASSFGVQAKQGSAEFENLITDLQEYGKITEMNEEFFMRNFLMLDIYFSELSFETVTQQKAFEFLSLLSEIGGFLGLLLGASILTVCEVLDYGLMHCLACVKKKKTVEQVQPLKNDAS